MSGPLLHSTAEGDKAVMQQALETLEAWWPTVNEACSGEPDADYAAAINALRAVIASKVQPKGTEGERDSFEAWARRSSYYLKRADKNPERYHAWLTNALWDGWQARASIQAPAPAQRTVPERITDAALKRAMGHPVVLEIMADCVSCADTENDAMSDPEFAVHDSAPYRLVEADLRCQAAAIRAQDPEIWPSLEFAAPAVAHSNNRWTVISPAGEVFTGESPFRAASVANKHWVKTDPEAAKRFADMVERMRAENEAENARLLAEHGTLNCPTCGGSGHIGDIRGAAVDVMAERQRQITAEGWTPEHDDTHADGSMALAAGCYALHRDDPGLKGAPAWWPWHARWWKPADPRRNLVKAGALILAEIERLDRASKPAVRPMGGE